MLIGSDQSVIDDEVELRPDAVIQASRRQHPSSSYLS